MYKVPNKAQLNKFIPVQIPKVKDVFKRRGFLRSADSSSSELQTFSRNPIEVHDHVSKQFDQYLYDEYAREQAELQKQQQPQQQPQQQQQQQQKQQKNGDDSEPQ